MKTRIKIKLLNLTTRDDAEAAMNDLALAMNNQRKILADRDAEILASNEAYAEDLAALDQAIKIRSDALRAWAESNPDQFPKDRKSLKLLAGILGFRTGTPKLSLLSRAFNWDKVLGLVRERLPGFIRIQEEVDKEGLLAASSQKQLDPTQLSTVGLKVTQDESFYVEPDLTQFATRQTTEVA